MTAPQILASLGFNKASVVNTMRIKKQEKVVVKVWTSKGWCYEKFATGKTMEDDITAWSRNVEPGQ